MGEEGTIKGRIAGTRVGLLYLAQHLACSGNLIMSVEYLNTDGRGLRCCL